MQFRNETKQIFIILFLLCFAFVSNTLSQIHNIEIQIAKAQTQFDNGEYANSLDSAQTAVKKAKEKNSDRLIIEGLKLVAASQIQLEKFSDAENSLNKAFEINSKEKNNYGQRAEIHIYFAWLWRAQQDYIKALEFSKKAVDEVPSDKFILGEHYLNLGRILFSSGYDFSAIIWLEKAEKIFESKKVGSAKLDTYRFLHFAWASKLNYQKALAYAKKYVSLSEKSHFKYRYRQALFDLSAIQSATGQKNASIKTMEKGKLFAQNENNQFQTCLFLSSLLLNSLYDHDAKNALKYLVELEKTDLVKAFYFEILLGKAIIAALKDQNRLSEELFDQLDRMENTSKFILPSWKIIIAKQKKQWDKVLNINQDLLELTEKEKFRDGLPEIYLNFAFAYKNLEQNQSALKYLVKSIALIEEIRQSENYNLALGLSETYHNAYRLLAEIKSDKPEESFELTDLLKARLLKDKIKKNDDMAEIDFSSEIRQKLENLSERLFDEQNVLFEIERTEKSIKSTKVDLNLSKPDLTLLNGVSELNNVAIISYYFTLDRKLQAFVWEGNKKTKAIHFPISEDEIEMLAQTTHRKIKDFIFFKKDGKEIHDKLLKPLNISAKHLIIIPDKSIWKIPFQALSSDGEKYLIEENLISYAPSVSILVDQLKAPKPNRQKLQALANSSFETKLLQYVNPEAAAVAGIYNSKPIINATVGDFSRASEKTDILHFSMHAEVASDQPLDSFLGFRKIGGDDGRLTVEELLNIKLKKGSLVFLASCDTNNVLSGEGLVSLAWGMMGSGATTVISAQWEANDKSTAIFTKTFYEHYKQGISSAESLQKASLELIKNKSGNMHEPYYWANFSLNGDFR